VCSVICRLPLTEVQSPALRVGVARRKIPPSSVSSRLLPASNAIDRESEWGALLLVVLVWVIQVHWVPAGRVVSQRNRMPSGCRAPILLAPPIRTPFWVSPAT